MKEINYQIFDPESGLPIESLTDEFIRETAQRDDSSLSETFTKTKTELENTGASYFLSKDKNKIFAISKGIRLSSLGEYFDEYSDAVNALIEKERIEDV